MEHKNLVVLVHKQLSRNVVLNPKAAVMILLYACPSFIQAAVHYRAGVCWDGSSEWLQVNKADCLIWIATFLGCLTIAIDVGLALGVSLGLLFLFVRTAFPVLKPLAQLPDSYEYRDIEMYDLQVTEWLFLLNKVLHSNFLRQLMTAMANKSISDCC